MKPEIASYPHRKTTQSYFGGAHQHSDSTFAVQHFCKLPVGSVSTEFLIFTAVGAINKELPTDFCVCR